MKAVILDGSTMGRDIDFSPIEQICETDVYPSSSNGEIKERIKDCDVLITNKIVLHEENLQYAQNLKLICVFAVGFNNIDISYCRKRNIRVRNVPGYSTPSVCQHTFCLLFSLMENIIYYNDFVKSGKYTESGIANHIGIPFKELSGLEWGIIGMGNIGRSVASVASAFGARVRYSSLSGVKRKEEYENIPLNKLLRESDIISIHSPSNENTRNLIGEKEFEMMKSSAYLINVGRGDIIESEALFHALKNGEIKGAGIDVYRNEPPLKDSYEYRLSECENAVLTPHIAWASTDARKRCVSITADNIKKFIKGEAYNDVWR